jgi:lysophospholipase L1-like esterase
LISDAAFSKATPMKNILCFGDSNTWGFDPASMTGSPYPIRFAPDVRWTGVLARELGADFRVIEEGQNGRTTVHEDPIMGHRNGSVYLPACLESHKPLDLVVLMLGTNDLKCFLNLTPAEIASGAGVLVKMILQGESGPKARAPKVLLLCPPATGDMSAVPDLAEKFKGADVRSRRFPTYYENIAAQHGIAYLNTQDIVAASPQDGLHLEASEHEKLGKAVADVVRSVLG